MKTGNVFEIAMKLEQKGIRFYKQVQDEVEEPLYKDVFEDLIQMEGAHYHKFKAMSEQSSEEMERDTLEKLKDVYSADPIFDLEKIVDFKKNTTISEIFELAREQEYLTVDYYTALQKAIGDPSMVDEIGSIIEEEKGHARIMETYLENLKKPD